MREADDSKDDLAVLTALVDAHGADPRRWPQGHAAWAAALAARNPDAGRLLAAAEAAAAALSAPRRRDLSDAAAAEAVLTGIASSARAEPRRRTDWRTLAASLLFSGAIAGAGVFAFQIGYLQGASDAAELMFGGPFADLPGGAIDGLLGDTL